MYTSDKLGGRNLNQQCSFYYSGANNSPIAVSDFKSDQKRREWVWKQGFAKKTQDLEYSKSKKDLMTKRETEKRETYNRGDNTSIFGLRDDGNTDEHF